MMKEIPFYKRLWFGVGVIAVFLIIVTISIGYALTNQYERERDNATTKAISEILKQEANTHPLIPDVLVINVSTKEKQLISDSIRNNVSRFLINRYTKKSLDSQVEIHPYVSFLEKSTNEPITSEQVAELKKYIEFLVLNCDKVVEDSKRNIDTEISKINTWVTIWIGIFGLMGIFIPILVNLKSLDTLKEVETKAKTVEDQIKEHSESIHAFEGIKKEVEYTTSSIRTISEALPKLKKQSEAALNNSKDAIALSKENQRVVQAMEAILKLSKLQNIVLYSNGNAIQIIHSLLASFLRSFSNIKENYNEPLYKDLLFEFSDKITELSRSIILRSRGNTNAISVFASFLNQKVSSGNISNTDHDEIVENFVIMLSQIKVDQEALEPANY